MSTTVTLIVVVAVGYLLGSVPVADRVARRHGVADLRRLGDGNPGFWNAQQQLGMGAAAPILAGDVGKGAIAAATGALLAPAGDWWIAYLGGGAAMVGHAWPAFARLRGGRSVATFIGAGIVCAPVPALLALLVAGLIGASRRDLAPAVRLGVAAFPVLQLVSEGPVRTAATGVLMTFVGLRFATAHHDQPDSARAASSSADDGGNA